MTHTYFARCAAGAVLVLLLCGVPTVAAGPEGAADTAGVAATEAETTDLLLHDAEFLQAPQNLTIFADQIGAETVLMDAALQAQRNAESDKLFFSPWSMARPSVSRQQFQRSLLQKPSGYHGVAPWTPAEWEKIVNNADAGNYPSPQGPGIVVRHADLRAMPTAEPRSGLPAPTPQIDIFDFLQTASLAVGTPVYIVHGSRDGHWLYVEYPLLSGWMRAEDVVPVSRQFIKSYQNGTYAVVLRDRLPLISVEHQALGTSHIGAVFPLVPGANPLEILVPVRKSDGTAGVEAVRPPDGAVLPKPLPLTAGALARIGNGMLGQPYAWGGSGENRDCSLAMRDLFAPFGIWLPRNSRSQVQTGQYLRLEKLSPQARKAKIVREGKPFLTLLGFSAHVGLYVGTHEGQPVMLHNILGVRALEKTFRYIIGGCVLSTLEPGKDLPDVQMGETLLERLRTLRNL